MYIHNTESKTPERENIIFKRVNNSHLSVVLHDPPFNFLQEPVDFLSVLLEFNFSLLVPVPPIHGLST